MQVTVRLFASHREAAKRDTLVIALPDGATVRDAFGQACASHPEIAGAASSVAFAVNREHVPPETPLRDGDELAILPPVAGG